MSLAFMSFLLGLKKNNSNSTTEAADWLDDQAGRIHHIIAVLLLGREALALSVSMFFHWKVPEMSSQIVPVQRCPELDWLLVCDVKGHAEVDTRKRMWRKGTIPD